MKRGYTAVLLCLVAVVTSMAQGPQQESVAKQNSAKAPHSTPTVDQIIDRYLQAIGGEAALRKATSRIINMTLVIEGDDVTASFESYSQAPNKKVEIGQVKLSNGVEFEISRGFNGAVGWALNPTSGGFRELSGTELAAEKRDAEFYWEIKLKELYPKMLLVGQAKIAGHTAYCVEATPHDGAPIKLYFEAQTGLLVRLDSIDEVANRGKVPDETYFEDYREVDGVKLPFTIRIPRVKYTFKVNEVKHNVPIDEAKFKSPRPTDLSSALAAIEKAVEVNRRILKVPGAALFIVKDDRVVLLKGFGVRDVEKGLPVTPDTLFGIASCTKTFTAMAAVTSADEGKLSLDDSPKKFLPYFKLGDPEADAKVTLRDLLSHRTGLKDHGNDDAWIGSERSPEEVIKIGMQSQPTAKFREKGQYNNIMYIAAGEAIAKAQNSTWEEVVASRIFKPLGMNASNFSSRAMRQAEDFSWSYDDSSKERKIFANRDAVAAAGAINSNARDMAQWLRLLLGYGSIDGKRIVSEAGFQEMLTELTKVYEEPYGLGLWVFDPKNTNGTQLYGHPGGVDGFNAEFAFAPARKLGFAILTNSSDAGATLYNATAKIVFGYLLLQPQK
jgi:CubicO group peptidase (beta-lactamase class C family)